MNSKKFIPIFAFAFFLNSSLAHAIIFNNVTNQAIGIEIKVLRTHAFATLMHGVILPQKQFVIADEQNIGGFTLFVLDWETKSKRVILSHNEQMHLSIFSSILLHYTENDNIGWHLTEAEDPMINPQLWQGWTTWSNKDEIDELVSGIEQMETDYQ